MKSYLLCLLTLVLFASANYSRSLHKKKLKEYREMGLRSPVDERALSDQVELSRKAVPVLFFLCALPVAFIQQLEGLAPTSLLKLSVGSIIFLTLFGFKLLLRVPLSWFTSFPLTWKKQVSAVVLGLYTGWLFSSVYTLMSNSDMRMKLSDAVMKAVGG